jgi:hypothetical protein
MPMESQDGRQTTAALARRVGNSASATQIADAIVSIWQEIDAALRPIIGQRGVAALYKRSLYLTASTHAWIGGTHEGSQAAVDLAPLRSVLAQQSSDDARSGGSALLTSFHGLLGTLVGPSLTERLLRDVWANTSNGAPTQGTQP